MARSTCRLRIRQSLHADSNYAPSADRRATVGFKSHRHQKSSRFRVEAMHLRVRHDTSQQSDPFVLHGLKLCGCRPTQTAVPSVDRRATEEANQLRTLSTRSNVFQNTQRHHESLGPSELFMDTNMHPRTGLIDR